MQRCIPGLRGPSRSGTGKKDRLPAGWAKTRATLSAFRQGGAFRAWPLHGKSAGDQVSKGLSAAKEVSEKDMDWRVGEIQPVPVEGWVQHVKGPQAPPLVQPVGRNQRTPLPTVDRQERDSRQRTPQKNEGNEEAADALAEALDVKEPAFLQVVYRKDDETGQLMIHLIDRRTGETVRKIPPEELARVQAQIEKYRGLLLDEKA